MRTYFSKIVAVMILLISFSLNNAADANNFLGSWRRVADFSGTARQYAVGFSIDTLGYLGLGADSAGLPNDFWSYSPLMNTWNPIAPFPYNGRTSAISFSNDSFGFVGMGMDTFYFRSDLIQYYPTLNTWIYDSSLPGSAGARTEAVGFAIGNTGYVTTGVGGASSYYNDLIQYDMQTNTFTLLSPVGSLPNPRFGATGFSLNGKGYMGTGIDDSTYYNDFWQYDPVNNAWTQLADFAGTPRFGAVSFTTCGYGYIGLGEDLNSTYRQDFWRYDPANNSWTFVNHFPGSGRRSAVAFKVNNKAYVGTGWDGSGRTKDVYEFSCDSTTGIASIQQNNTATNIFPNPNNGNFEMSYDLNGSASGELLLTDVTGKTIATYQLSSAKNILKINQTNLKNGIYFYSIKTSDKTIAFGKFSVIK